MAHARDLLQAMISGEDVASWATRAADILTGEIDVGIWGKGLLQSHDDYQIAKDLSKMFDCKLFYPVEEDKEDTIKKLNDGLLAKMFDKVLERDFQPLTSYHKRERVAIILGILAMLLGAIIEDRHMRALRLLRPWLPNMEQQLQLVTALDEYKNDGTPWELGSKGPLALQNTGDFPVIEGSEGQAVVPFDCGDEFYYSGLGHSLDEPPTSEMSSKVCLECWKKPATLRRCTRCKMARYCNTACQRADWGLHKKVCERRKSVRTCPVPPPTDEQMS
ncbi:hypothetical protein GGR54DRAFT_282011 [Hypoxylon sp. NC1633]|nr:hypothetical protein GGR54DRAFT_282011 [Hypoxylon sp. NC1633]